jgi:putative ATPase
MATPLADRLRPTNLDEVYGQRHILGEGKLLRRIAESGDLPNMIFYGPSGTGKTTTANILAAASGKRLHRLNATNASLSDVKAIIEEIDTMLAPGGILLYLDEIQYFNKKQQQSLLEFVENGKITLIASTTENPYFYVYNALLSRCTVFEFKPVPREEIAKAVRRAVATLAKERNFTVEFEQEAFDYVCASCAGDVRKSINAVELLCMAKPGQTHIYIDMEMARQAAQGSAVKYDRDSDYHYDLLSAFQKSLRGSDENAALHYLARLLSAGDLASVCRRLLVTAAEDVGLAYPNALIYCKAAVDSALQLGLPEARIPLADAVIMVATAPKSNSGICAIDAAMADVASGNYSDVPSNIQDAHYEGAKKLGHGQTYIYPHGHENNWVKQQYLPDKLKDTVYYEYGDNKLEQATKAYWDKIKHD